MNKTFRQFTLSTLAAALVLSGCGGSGDNPPTSVNNSASPSVENPAPPNTPTIPDPAEPVGSVDVPVFADGPLTADITRTTFGVPHITADSLEEIAFGSGYTQAQDHLCILADAFVKANSRRSEFFGPHASINIATGEITAEDNGNLITDFGYLATGIRAAAEANIDSVPERSSAILSGFAAGYNKYVGELATNPAPNLPCAGQPWVMPIEGVDLLTYMYSIALLPGAANFFDLMFFANPGDGFEYLPRLAPVEEEPGKPAAKAADNAAAIAMLNDVARVAEANKMNLTYPDTNPMGLGSNGWGLGSEMTSNGKGIVLANPHFPHTGQIRFHQTHLTIPGYMDVTGGSLIGMPGAVNIGYNQNVAWTHTFSTAEHFVVYQLALKEEDRQTYFFDGNEVPIEMRTETILVNVGGGLALPFEKDIYVTPRGPVIEAPPEAAPFGWDDAQAFYIQDANMFNNDVIEHWVAMNLARNLAEFQQAFKDYDGVIFNNTMYADDQGNAWYIDDSTVPGLTIDAETGIVNDPTLAGLRAQAGFTILPGQSSIFGFTDAEPYENAPKLLSNQYVQNSNDSFWLTNAESPIDSYVSPLYGQTNNPQTMRSRMGHQLIKDSAGADGKFDNMEVEAALFSNRSYFGEVVLPGVLAQCSPDENGRQIIEIQPGLDFNVIPACEALTAWQATGAQNLDAVGGALLREFAYAYCADNRCVDGFSGAFDASNPTTTPSGVPTDGSALVALAKARYDMELAVNVEGEFDFFDINDTLGEYQFVEKSGPDGSPSGVRIPWPGANNREGGFNVFGFNFSSSQDGTLLPHHSYPRSRGFSDGETLPSGLGSEGYHVRYGSSWMMVVQFTDDGPQGRGILTFSQSNNFLSPHWNDQTLYYSQNNSLRPMLFTADEVAAGALSTMTLTAE